MPLTSYCKKCAQDVPVSEVCPHCGAKLPASSVRLTWCVEHTPVRDWICWNSIMRLVFPLLSGVLVLLVLLEGLMSGAEGVGRLLSGGLLGVMAALLILMAALMLLVLMLQGDDLLDCVMDSKGIHILQYLPEPTALKLLLRLKSPERLRQMTEEQPMLLLNQTDIAWREVARVQLWPEKLLLLCYAPSWWLRLALPCTPFTWVTALNMVQEKLGRKKTVKLPPELQAAPRVRSRKTTGAAQSVQEKSTAAKAIHDTLGEKPSEEPFSVADVLEEIKAMEKADREEAK